MKRPRDTAPEMPQPPTSLRKAEDLVKLSRRPNIERMVAKNYYNQSAAKVPEPPVRQGMFQKLSDYLPNNPWPWISKYLNYTFSPKEPFRTYSANSKNNGVYKIGPQKSSSGIELALYGDWATGTLESWTIAELIRSSNPDFTIHLGDVYYVGDDAEIEQNCFGKNADGFDGVTMPKGVQGSFALNGNHEMYANGGPYFRSLLPRLGMKNSEKGQEASYFCLESEFWRIIAIDTGYNSVGIPLLGAIPLLREIPWIGTDCRLEQDFLDWLKTVVQVKTKPKATLVLGHHNYFSAFSERVYTRPARQMAEFFQDQEFIWLWGHEHRLGIYDKFKTPEGLTVYGRCIGHGGMPIEMVQPDKSIAPLKLYDTRSHVLSDGSPVGQNGFVKLKLTDDKLTLIYVDIDNIELFSEEFKPDSGGRLFYASSSQNILTQCP